MSDGLLWHRFQFAFTVTYHYLFPQLTMGLALLIVVIKALALRRAEGVTTTSRGSGGGSSRSISPWASSRASRWSSSSGRTGPASPATPAGSSARPSRWRGCSPSSPSPRSSVCSCSARSGSARGGISWRPWRCSWARGSRATSSSPPTRSCSTRSATDGRRRSAPGDISGLPSQPVGALGVRAQHGGGGDDRRLRGVGGRRVLDAAGRHARHARGLRRGLWRGWRPASWSLPHGGRQGKLVAEHQPAALAAMEGKFESGPDAELALIGQPNVAAQAGESDRRAGGPELPRVRLVR